MAQEKLLFPVKYRFLSLMILLVLTVVPANATDASISNLPVSTSDKEWVMNMVHDAKKMTIDGIKDKYIELKRMLAKADGDEITNDLSDEELAKDLFGDSWTLRVFVSSSMSNELLKKYINEAKYYKAILVFNGLPNGSWRELSEIVTKITDESDEVAIQIDDEAFKSFGIVSVPSFVLSRDDREEWKTQLHRDEGGRSFRNTYDKLVGNISIHGALEMFSKEGELASIADELLVEAKEYGANPKSKGAR